MNIFGKVMLGIGGTIVAGLAGWKLYEIARDFIGVVLVANFTSDFVKAHANSLGIETK